MKSNMKHSAMNTISISFLLALVLLGCGSGSNNSNSSDPTDTLNDRDDLPVVELESANDPCPTIYNNNAGEFLTCGVLELSVSGTGFLVLSDRGSQFFSRSQTFTILGGRWVSSVTTGAYLQGYPADQNGNVSIGVLGDINLENVDINSVTIDVDGIIKGVKDNREQVLGQIVLATFDAPFFLELFADDTFIETELSGLPIVGSPLSGSLGSVNAGELESQLPEFALNWSVDGEGYFYFKRQGNDFFSNSNTFVFDRNGNLVLTDDVEITPSNQVIAYNIQGYVADSSGSISSSISNLGVFAGDLLPKSTSDVDVQVNLDAGVIGIDLGPIGSLLFNPSDPTTYHVSTNQVIFDSQGNSHTLSLYFQKEGYFEPPFINAPDNTWNLFVYIDDEPVTNGAPSAPAAVLTFSVFGDLDAIDGTFPAPIRVDNWNPSGGVLQAPASNFDIDLSRSTQVNADFSVINYEQNGYSPGRFTSISVSDCGIISANYQTGSILPAPVVTLALGQMTIAQFNNPSALSEVDNNVFVATGASGIPSFSKPCDSGAGSIEGDLVD